MLICDRQRILGEGGFATVFEGTWGGVKVAVKRILKSNAVTTEQEERALKMLDHINVIKLFHVEEDQDFKSFALELCDASLDKLFLQENDPNKYRGPMPPETEVLLQLAKGLAYIHQMGLVHRDIKPQNVLISSDSTTRQVAMKWADFGFSKSVNERGTFSISGVRGTHNWLAPELLTLPDEAISSTENQVPKRGTVKSDVFAEGLVFGYFLSKGIHPFGTSSYEIEKNVLTKKPTNLPKTEIRDLMKRMLEKNPKHRVESSTVVEILQEIPVLMMFTLLKGRNPSVEKFEKLIKEGVNINAKNRRGLTPLLCLAENKKKSDNLVEIVSLLIQNGANVNSLSRKGKNALLLWCGNTQQHRNQSYFATINLFIEKGIDINCKDKNGDNALTLLCEHYGSKNLIDIIPLFIEKGIDINWKNEDEDNALTILCENYKKENLIDIIRLLIENGMDINYKNMYGDNALTLLCENYKKESLIEITRLLIERGINADCKNEDGDNALTLLCGNYENENLFDITRLLIENGVEVNCKTEDKDNALILLCRLYRKENLIAIIQLLIEKGIDINCKNENGDNALTSLCENYENENLIDIIQLLFKKGIDINCKNEDGDTAFTFLCRYHRNENLIDIIRLFIEKGIDINCNDRYGGNALINLCQSYGNENLIEIIKCFIENGFDVTPETYSIFQRIYYQRNRNEVLQLLAQQHPDEPAIKRIKSE